MFYDRISYTRSTFRRDDGSQVVVGKVVVEPPYTFEVHSALQESRRLKLHDVAHLLFLKAKSRGAARPNVLVWDAYPHEETFTIPTLDFKRRGLVRVSKNSCITSTLRSLVRRENISIIKGKPQVKKVRDEVDQLGGQYLELLMAEDRVLTAGYGGDMLGSAEADVAAVGPVGFPSRYARENGYPLVVNASYFLFEPEDYHSDFSLFGEAYGLHIHQGQIELPPLFKRSALLFDEKGEASLVQVSLQDLIMYCLGREWDLSQFALNKRARYAVFNRYYGVATGGRTIGVTPVSDEHVDFVIIGRAVVGYKVGGKTEIPHNGFVLSLPLEELEPGEFEPVVRYRFAKGGNFVEGIQCGPGLVRDGQIILNDRTLTQEEFFRKRRHPDGQWDSGVVPTDYAEDIDQTRAARITLGVGFSGELLICAVEAVNRGMEENAHESSGVTLKELAQLAQASGFRHALNLDGGGSANIQYAFGHLIRGADRRGLPGVIYERMVPSVGVATN